MKQIISSTHFFHVIYPLSVADYGSKHDSALIIYLGSKLIHIIIITIAPRSKWRLYQLQHALSNPIHEYLDAICIRIQKLANDD